MLNNALAKGKVKVMGWKEQAAEKAKKIFFGKKEGANQFVAAALLILFAIGIGLIFYKTSNTTISQMFSQLDDKIRSIFSSFIVG